MSDKICYINHFRGISILSDRMNEMTIIQRTYKFQLNIFPFRSRDELHTRFDYKRCYILEYVLAFIDVHETVMHSEFLTSDLASFSPQNKMNGLGVLKIYIENNRARKLNTSPHFILIKPSIDPFTNFYAKQQTNAKCLLQITT